MLKVLHKIKKNLTPPIKLYWWRLNEGRTNQPGNFGDEITKEIIENVFHRRVEWSEFENCDIVGAGSIIEEVTKNKKTNQPYLWGSGFIEAGNLTISPKDYKILAVRGKQSLQRIVNPPSTITLGDPGLLASLVLPTPTKDHSVGLVPHYADMDNPLIIELAKRGVKIIDATWPCKTVLREIAKCDAILSSSMHGLIVADSFGVPNLHLKLSDKLKGGSYKFNDYYSIFSVPRYQAITPKDIENLSIDNLKSYIRANSVSVSNTEMSAIKQRLIDTFPY